MKRGFLSLAAVTAAFVVPGCGNDTDRDGRTAKAVPDVPSDALIRHWDDSVAKSADGLSETRRPTELGLTGATFAGAVNPKGKPGKYWFEYGPSTSYGTATTPKPLPPKLAAHYYESFDKSTANWRGGLTGADLAFRPDGFQSPGSVRFSEPSGVDANHADGIGENQLCHYTWIGSYYPGTAADPAFFGGGDPDLRDAKIKVAVRGNGWVANGSELVFWLQSDTDLAKQSDDNVAQRANWAYTGFNLTDALVSGQWQAVEYRLQNDPNKWTYSGASVELAKEPRYVYLPLDNALGHLNNDIFHMLVFVDPAKQPAGSIDFDELDITYRNYSLVFPSNGAKLVSSPPGSDNPATLTDGWRNGAGKTWKSAANPTGPLEIEYELANPVTIRAVQIHQNPDFPSKEVEVWVSTDGANYTRLSGGPETPAILPQSSPGGPNYAYYLDDKTRRRLTFGREAPVFPTIDGVQRVKIKILSGYQAQAWGLGEIEIFGSGGKDFGTDDDDVVTLNEDVPNLAPGSTVHYRLVTETAAGKSFAGDKTYEVPKDARPFAYTLPATRIGNRTAKLEGRVGPLGHATSYYFLFNSGADIERTDPTDAGVENTPRTVTATLTDLEPGKTYKYRLVAENEKGSSYGEELTFVAK